MRGIILVLLVACVAGLAAHSALAESTPRSIRITDDAALAKKKKPAKAPGTCADNKDKHDCLKLGSEEGECGWCEGTYMPASCMSAMAAKYLPETVAKCKLPKKDKEVAAVDDVDTLSKKKKPAKAPATCADNKDKHDCVKLGSDEGDCAWCEGGYMPASCLSAMAAKYLPEMVATCKLPKKHKDDEADDDDDDDDIDTLAKKKKPAKAPATCADNKDKHDCVKLGSDEGDCAWCEGGYMPASCLTAMAAKYLPEMVATCKLPKKHKDDEADDDDDDIDTLAKKKKPAKAPATCADNKDKHDCVKLGSEEGECGWCEGKFMPASCMTAMAAKYLPETVAKCKLPKKDKEDVVEAATDSDGAANKKKKPAKAPASCADNKDKHDCLKLGSEEGECGWCEGTYMPASCMSAMAAKYLPETVAKCKLPKKHKVAADESALEEKTSEDGSGSGGDWPSGGGDWPSGGGSSGGGGDYPYGPGGGGKSAGKGCRDFHSRHKCMKGSKSEGACAWCAKGSMVVGEGCVPEKMIQWLPKMVADCEVGKDRRKKASVQVS